MAAVLCVGGGRGRGRGGRMQVWGTGQERHVRDHGSLDVYLVKGRVLRMRVKPWLSALSNILQSIGFGQCEVTNSGQGRGGEGEGPDR